MLFKYKNKDKPGFLTIMKFVILVVSRISPKLAKLSSSRTRALTVAPEALALPDREQVSCHRQFTHFNLIVYPTF